MHTQPTRARSRVSCIARRWSRASVVVIGTLALTFSMIPASRASTGSISGSTFQDLDRNGLLDIGESAFANHQLYLFDSSDHYLGTTVSAPDGTFSFDELSDGDYRVQYASPSWWPIRETWVPTTTGSVMPRVNVHLSGSARADFGWRPITTSTNLALPVSSYTGSNGLRIDAYNDAVPARDVFDELMKAMVGTEAQFIQIRFAYGSSSVTASGWGTDGAGDPCCYSAASYVTYLSWLDTGDQTLDHEYGHAWSNYYAAIVQRDPALGGYLHVRGLESDPRLGSAYEWDPKELIAEDFRQLFGSENGRSAAQMNTQIPSAAAVPGLREYLSTTFMGATAPPPTPTPTPTMTPTPSASPTPAPSPTSTATPGIQLSVTGLAVNPNPMKRSGIVAFSLTGAATVTVTIVDANGAVVTSLASSVASPSGAVSFAWNRTDAKGKRAHSGTYSARVTAMAGSTTTTSSCSFIVS